MKVRDLFYEWLDGTQRERIKVQTYVRYKSLYDINIDPKIGDFEIEQITKRDMQEFMWQVKRAKSDRTGMPLSGTSVNMILTLCKLMFEYAIDFDMLRENPCARIKSIPARNFRKVVAFTRGEQLKIEDYVDHSNNTELFGILLDFYTGLRIGELLALEWEDIDLKHGIISVNKTVFTTVDDEGNWYTKIDTPKTRTSNREIPIPDWMIEKLKERKKQNMSKWVVYKNDGSSVSGKRYARLFSLMLDALEIEPHHFHAIRHTFATRALENGMDVRTLADILGHANPNVTLNVYAHSMTEHKRNCMNNMTRITSED